jgi:hypothetical protein
MVRREVAPDTASIAQVTPPVKSDGRFCMNISFEFTVNSTPGLLKKWLKRATWDFPYKSFPWRSPYVAMQPLREEGLERMTCDALLIEQVSEERSRIVLGITPFEWKPLAVDIVPLAADRTKLIITAEDNPLVQPYLERLLAAIRRDYPETGGTQQERGLKGADKKTGAPRLEERPDWEEKVERVQRIDAKLRSTLVTLEAACRTEKISPKTYRNIKRRMEELKVNSGQ